MEHVGAGIILMNTIDTSSVLFRVFRDTLDIRCYVLDKLHKPTLYDVESDDRAQLSPLGHPTFVVLLEIGDEKDKPTHKKTGV